MKSNIKILLAHPGQQHSFRVAKVLKENGLLFKYATTVYNKENSVFMKFARLFLKGNTLKRANNRKCEALNNTDVILFNEFSGYLLLLIIRLVNNRKVYVWLNDRIKNSFGTKVANYAIKNNVDVVICYDTSAEKCFEILMHKAPQIIRIMDNAAVARNFLYKIFEINKVVNKDFVKTYDSFDYLIDLKKSEKFTNELKMAHFHIVASNFAKRALLFNNVLNDKIILVPYGVDTEKFKPSKRKDSNSLNILYVGAFDQRKGIAQILNAAKEINKKDIIFNLVGGNVNKHNDLFIPFNQFVNFKGSVPSSIINSIYAENDVFIFPSIGDGFGLVILEAMASGLPVIASRNCAGPDIIQDGYNGFLIDEGDCKSLKERILWFYDNPSMLQDMSKKDCVEFYLGELREKIIRRLKQNNSFT